MLHFLFKFIHEQWQLVSLYTGGSQLRNINLMSLYYIIVIVLN
jgi:hypothetical protein